MSQFKLFELILLVKLDRQFLIEQFEPTVSQSTVPSPLSFLPGVSPRDRSSGAAAAAAAAARHAATVMTEALIIIISVIILHMIYNTYALYACIHTLAKHYMYIYIYI